MWILLSYIPKYNNGNSLGDGLLQVRKRIEGVIAVDMDQFCGVALKDRGYWSGEHDTASTKARSPDFDLLFEIIDFRRLTATSQTRASTSE